MTPEQWERVNDLFHEASELSEADASALLRGEPEAVVARELERLLAAERDASGFIEEPAVARAPSMSGLCPADECNQGDRLGPYRVVKELGRGGMGAVYLAERADESYESRVAIKVIRRGFESAALLNRFLNERQILASLEHPNIARLLDGRSNDAGLPYIVMEYVDGEPISAYCSRLGLSVRARLQLFQRVCEAVAYAHQRLVIHRDLKPSNILVTTDGEPKLLDFGIAKILTADADDVATSTVLHAMTPQYASPEQAEGKTATTVSDVYSLGVVLYELLAGSPPYSFEGLSPEGVLRTIRTVEPLKPSAAVGRQDSALGRTAGEATESEPARDGGVGERRSERPGKPPDGAALGLIRRLRGDVDTIVLKALNKDPQRRYQSAEQFSADIQRHLDGMPVLAREDTVFYRGAKFVGRNRVAVAAAGMVAITLMGGIGATLWQAREAKMQAQLANEAQIRAERRFNEVRKMANSVLFDYHDAIRNLPGSTPVREKLVQDALEYLDSLASETADAELQRELAAAYERLGGIQGGTMFANLGDSPGALASHRRALAILEKLANEDPEDPSLGRQLARCHRNVSDLLVDLGDLDTALEHSAKSEKIFETLARKVPDPVVTREHANALDRSGMLLLERGDLAGAESRYRMATSILEGLPEPLRSEPETRRSLSVVADHISAVLLQLNRLEHALEYNTKALELRAALAAEFPNNADYRRTWAVVYYSRADILVQMQRFSAALDSYRKCAQISAELNRADPKNELYRGDLAYSSIRVGDMLAKRMDYAGALGAYRKSLALRSEDVRADPAHVWKRASLIEAHTQIGKTLAASGNYSLALEECEMTSTLLEKTDAEPGNVTIWSFFADTHADLGATYLTIARQPNIGPEERKQYYRAAKASLGRAVSIWDDLRSRGMLSQVNHSKPAKALEGMAQCDKAMTE